MKNFLYSTVILFCVSFNMQAQNIVRNNYTDKNSNNASLATPLESSLESSTQLVNNTIDTAPEMGGIFGQYVGYEKNAWGLELIRLFDKELGFNSGARFIWVDSKHSTMWYTLGTNYSINLVNDEDSNTLVFLAGSFDLGFNLTETTVPEFNNDGSIYEKETTKFYLDAIITPRLVVKSGHIGAYIGYQWTANKFKFDKKNTIDGLTIGLGYTF